MSYTENAMIAELAQGFGTGCGLIIAIGAQNAYVLTQSIKREHHLAIALVCSLCDAVLISAGVAGLGALIANSPVLRMVAGWGGAAFLTWYGINSFRSALRGQSGLRTENGTSRNLKAAVVFTLALTLLNPHVYVDTLVLLGGISAQFEGQGRYVFGVGAILASFFWFFSLSLGGRLLAPVLSSPKAWRIMDGIIGCIMFSIAAGLIAHTMGQ